MADGRQLDPSSDEYRIVAGLIRSAHESVGVTDSHWWNGRVGVLPTTSRTYSRTDRDGTIHLHPRNVIAPLRRAGAGGHDRWWNPKATRDASYSVIYEALRVASPTSARGEANKPLDSALPAGVRDLDRALTEQRTYEIAEHVMTQNGLGDAYEPDAPEVALGGHGLSAGPLNTSAFRLNNLSTVSTAAARGLVDGITDATGIPRDRVFDTLLRSAKGNRWAFATSLVAESRHRGVVTELAAKGIDVDATEVQRAAGREWARTSSFRKLTISTIEAAEQYGYAIGQDAAGVVIKAGQDLAAIEPENVERSGADLSKPVTIRELSPAEVLAPQTPPTGTPSAPGTAATQRSGAERPEHQVDR
ncbi:hypothetical protein ACWGID_34355 [Kribbella sp. NPDC054772]